MVSTEWVQGRDKLNTVLTIREEVFAEESIENKITDFYDDFAFNAVLYTDSVPAATGRLLFKEGKYFIDMLCVKKQFKGQNYEDLLVRMLVRKAITIGATKVYMEADESRIQLLEKIGFLKVSKNNLMVKEGDVAGHCCVKC
ncbi:MAG: GNAT family N-acetyltransferase [Tissierellia bacterium]|nr:GNAT family N-acetyltransferase [Tissierellia bacterium]